jgi:hypothetical protein
MPSTITKLKNRWKIRSKVEGQSAKGQTFGFAVLRRGETFLCQQLNLKAYGITFPTEKITKNNFCPPFCMKFILILLYYYCVLIPWKCSWTNSSEYLENLAIFGYDFFSNDKGDLLVSIYNRPKVAPIQWNLGFFDEVGRGWKVVLNNK